jgi:2-methylcitrate dehydratase PrpD
MEIAGSPRCRITVKTYDGRVLRDEVTYPRGHSLNPMTVEDVTAKFHKATDGVINPAQQRRVLDAWWDVDRASDIRPLMATIADFGAGA